MALGGKYKTGTASVSAGSTAVTFVGAALVVNDIMEGDTFQAAGQSVGIESVTDDLHLVLDYGWPGAVDLSASTYVIKKDSWLRYDPALALNKLSQFLNSNVFKNVRLALTGAATASNSDKGKTVALGGGAAYTYTFNAASGYDSDFAQVIVNEDTDFNKTVAPNGIASITLYPSQSVIVFCQNNVWYTHGTLSAPTASATFASLTLSKTNCDSPILSLTQSGALASAGVIPGIVSSQTLSGGDGVSTYAFNELAIADATLAAAVTGVSINYSLRTGWKGQKVALGTDIVVDQDPGSYPGFTGIPVALSATAHGPANVNPTYLIGLFAANFGVNVSGTGYGALVGNELDIGITSTGSATNRVGQQIFGTGTVAGTLGIDTGYYLGINPPDPGWDFGWAWSANTFKTTSTIFGTANATNAKYGVDFAAVTFTSGGFAFRSPGFSVDPSGNIAAKTTTITSNSASALAVGPNGLTTPTFTVRASSPGAITGLVVQGQAAGGGLSLFAAGETNVNFSIDAQGAGAISFGGTSTGNILINRAIFYGGVLLSNAVTGIGPMVLGTNATLTTPTIQTILNSAGIAFFPSTVSAPKMFISADATGSESFFMQFQTHDGAATPGNVQIAGRFLADIPLLNINATSTVHSGTSRATGFKVGSNQVVGARITGYTAMTGSPDKATAYATSTVTLAQLAGRVAQLQADLTTHGLIGT